MHICLVSREYPPFFGGGIGTYTVQFSQTLAAAGHQVVILTIGGHGREKRDEAGPVTIIRLPFIKGDDWSKPHPAIDTPEHRAALQTFAAVSIFAMQVARALPRLHDEFGFDIVEAPDTGALAWFTLNGRRTAGPWARRGPAVVTCIHSPTDWIAHYNRVPLHHPQLHELVGMERDSLRWSDGLICPSAAVAMWAEEHCALADGSIDIIPYCLGDLQPEAEAHAARAGERTDATSGAVPRRILFASRLEARKGVDTLLEGFARAVERGADLHLDLVGEDTLLPGGGGHFGDTAFRSLTAAGAKIASRVVFHGKQPPVEVARMQAAAHAAAIPAPMDNFPFTCMEAMARGRVVIAARAGGMADMVGGEESGLLFAPGDGAKCAEALLRFSAMSQEQLRMMERRAAARILEVCRNETVIPRRVAHYERAAARRRAALAAHETRQRRAVVLVNADLLPAAEASRLSDAVALAPAGACDFAHGWVRLRSGEVVAFSTPGAVPARCGISDIGPVALVAEAADHASIAPLLPMAEMPGHRTCGDSAMLVKSLCGAGFVGAVIPEVCTPVGTPRSLGASPSLPSRSIWKVVRAFGGVVGRVRLRGGAAAAEYHTRWQGLAARRRQDGGEHQRGKRPRPRTSE